MDSENNIFEKLGGRKFVLTVCVMIALIAIAIAQPTALSTELVVGLLGVIATYSGSNAFLTSFAMKQPGKQADAVVVVAAAEEQTVEQGQQQGQHASDYSAEILDLQTRMAQNEKTTAEIIEIIKQLMQRKNT